MYISSPLHFLTVHLKFKMISMPQTRYVVFQIMFTAKIEQKKTHCIVTSKDPISSKMTVNYWSYSIKHGTKIDPKIRIFVSLDLNIQGRSWNSETVLDEINKKHSIRMEMAK